MIILNKKDIIYPSYIEFKIKTNLKFIVINDMKKLTSDGVFFKVINGIWDNVSVFFRASIEEGSTVELIIDHLHNY